MILISFPAQFEPWDRKYWRTFMFVTLMKLWKNEDGATAIEYGLIAALIAVAAISAFQLVGTNLSNTFHGIATQL
jgi:pilus assembly protein Flp/PilA